jgi:hypothetical protein
MKYNWCEYGSEKRSQNRLWQMITDYENRAKATKNDIKRDHYMKMAQDLRYKLKTSDEQGVAEGYDMLWIVYRQDTTLYPNGERDHETKVVKTFNNDREAEDYANKLNAANRDDDVYYFVRSKKQGVAEDSDEGVCK